MINLWKYQKKFKVHYFSHLQRKLNFISVAKIIIHYKLLLIDHQHQVRGVKHKLRFLIESISVYGLWNNWKYISYWCLLKRKFSYHEKTDGAFYQTGDSLTASQREFQHQSILLLLLSTVLLFLHTPLWQWNISKIDLLNVFIKWNNVKCRNYVIFKIIIIWRYYSIFNVVKTHRYPPPPP